MKRVNLLVPVLGLMMIFMKKGFPWDALPDTGESQLGCLGQAVHGEKGAHELALVYFLFLFHIVAFCLYLPQMTAARTRRGPTALWPSKSTCAATGTTAKPAAAPAARPTPSARQHPRAAPPLARAPLGYHLVSATHPTAWC